MRGASLAVHVTTPSPSLIYTGCTVPKFVQDLTVHTPDSSKLTKFVDVSAVLAVSDQGKKEVRIAIVNRAENDNFEVPILFGPQTSVKDEIVVHQVWHEDIKANNGFDMERVKTVVTTEKYTGIFKLKKHSFQSAFFLIFLCKHCHEYW